MPGDSVEDNSNHTRLAGEPFHAGELPVAEAQIEVEDRFGVRVEGGA